MKFLENDLEEIIYKTPNEKLRERGFEIYGKKLRQVTLGNYGRSDIITFKRMGDYIDVTVFEFKKDNINLSAFLQAVNYCKGIQRYMEKYYEDIHYIMNIVLVGKKLDLDSSYTYIPDLFISGDVDQKGTILTVSNYTYDYGFDGITFKNHQNYSLIEENLKRR